MVNILWPEVTLMHQHNLFNMTCGALAVHTRNRSLTAVCLWGSPLPTKALVGSHRPEPSLHGIGFWRNEVRGMAKRGLFAVFTPGRAKRCSMGVA